MRNRALHLIAAGALTLCAAPAVAEPILQDEDDFAEYVAVFNAADPSFVNYYSADVVFDKGPPDGVLEGRGAIAGWYALIWQDFAETLTPLTVVLDAEAGVMMVELRTELQARRDGIVWRDRTFDTGDRLIADGTIVYTLQGGLISSIRGAAEGREIIRAVADAGAGN